MKNIKISLLFLSAFYLFLLNSCKKDNSTTVPLKQDVISFFGVAKTGSYYVFKDSVSGIVDTFKLSKYSNTRTNCYTTINGKSEYTQTIVYTYTTTYSQQTIHVTLDADCDLDYMATINMEFGAAWGSFNLNYTESDFDRINPQYSTSDTILSTILPTYSVDNTTYNDVLYLDDIKEYGAYVSSDFWIAKNIGILQIKNQRKNWNWKLINKKIIL
ncbi:MAG: hypothetical protein JWO03_2251 [Bacteroidetes bacterium]|nr:hypothetical protein [Bacteroidota bacterium]